MGSKNYYKVKPLRNMKTLTILLFTFLASIAINAQVKIGTEIQVNTYTTDDQYEPKLASDAAGNFVVVWPSVLQDLDGEAIVAQLYDLNGSPLGGEIMVNTTTVDDQYSPDVAMDLAGNFVVVWTSAYQDGDDDGVFFQRFNKFGVKLGGEVQVNQTTALMQGHPSIAMDNNGNFAVAWVSWSGMLNGNTDDIMFRLYDNLGTPTTSETLVSSPPGGNFIRCDVAMGPTGNFVIGFHDLDSDGRGVFARSYDSTGIPISTLFQVNSYVTDHQEFSALAMTNGGDFVVAGGKMVMVVEFMPDSMI